MMKRDAVKVLVLAGCCLPITLAGCGKKPVTDVVADTTPIEMESQVETEVPETIEESLAEEGIVVEATEESTEPIVDPNLDVTMAGTFYIVGEEQSIYATADKTSEVVATYAIDTEIEVSGVYGDTGMFAVISREDSSLIGYVDSEYCDVVKGGYQVDEDSAMDYSDAGSVATSELKNGDDFSTEDNPYAGLDWFEALTPEKQKAMLDAHKGAVEDAKKDHTFDTSWGDEFETGSGYVPDPNDAITELRGSGAGGNVVVN